MTPKDIGGAPEAYGIADVGKPGTSVPFEGMTEQNIEKPNQQLPKNEHSGDDGEETSGPKD